MSESFAPRKGLRRLAALRDLVGRGFDGEAFLRDVVGAQNIHPDGDEIRHSCPLPFGMHPNGDQNPSASFNKRKLVFNCFACGGMGVVEFVQTVHDCSEDDAIRLIQRFATPGEIEGVYDPASVIADIRARFAEEEWVKPQIPTFSERIVNRWKCYSAYLDERGVTREVQKEMRTGVDLGNKDKVGSVWLEQPRVVIPHFWKGQLVGWSKRKILASQFDPKYKHSPGFPKSLTLYGLDQTDTDEPLVVVESPLSVLRMKSEGFTNCVATFGAAVKEDQARELRAFDRVTIAFDGDSAGAQGAAKLTEMIKGHCYTKVAWLSPGTDPGDLDREALDAVLASAVISPLAERRNGGTAKRRQASGRRGAKRGTVRGQRGTR
jgi:hypothetical protein